MYPTDGTIQETQQSNEAENLQQETQEVTQPAEAEIKKANPETAQAKSFRELRQKAERIERERDEALRMMQEMQSRTAQPNLVDDDDDITLNDSDLVEGKHLHKFQKKIRKLEEKFKTQNEQSRATTAEMRLKAQYPDFDKVVSKDNIEALRSQYPEIADVLNTSADLYSKAVSAYTLIKKFGIETEDLYEADRATAQRNAAKPRPLTSVSPQEGDSPLSHANAFAQGLTDDLKKKLHAEMIQAIRNR